jgi:hypothetical protein
MAQSTSVVGLHVFDYISLCLIHCIMYDLHVLSHRFRMNRELFVNIIYIVEEYNDYFVRRMNATSQFGLSCFQMVTAVFRKLTYGMSADATDEYCRIRESTNLKCLRMFTKAVIALFGEEYLRPSNENDTTRLLALGEDRGFPGMLGSIDSHYYRTRHHSRFIIAGYTTAGCNISSQPAQKLVWL